MKDSFFIPGTEAPVPAVRWGEPGEKCLIAVHGNLSHKEDTVIKIAAEKALGKDYHVISFDLPKHGERREQPYELTPENSRKDIRAVYRYAQSAAREISLFGCSLGAYFSLLALSAVPIEQTLFLSPVVNMERVIQNMMAGFNVSEQRLHKEGKIPLPIGQVLDWDYYSFVKSHPIRFDWSSPIEILYGEKDELCEWDALCAFAQRYGANVRTLKDGEHFFHTDWQLAAFEHWMDQSLR